MSRAMMDALVGRAAPRDQAQLLANGIGHGWMSMAPNHAIHTILETAECCVSNGSCAEPTGHVPATSGPAPGNICQEHGWCGTAMGSAQLWMSPLPTDGRCQKGRLQGGTGGHSSSGRKQPNTLNTTPPAGTVVGCSPRSPSGRARDWRAPNSLAVSSKESPHGTKGTFAPLAKRRATNSCQ